MCYNYPKPHTAGLREHKIRFSFLKKMKLLIVLSLLPLVVIVFGYMLQYALEQPSNKINPETLKSISADLTLISYNNDYSKVISSLPSCVSDMCKADLEVITSQKYNSRATHGMIKPLEKVLYSQEVVEDRSKVYVVSKYKELQMFNNVMTSVAMFDIEKGTITAIALWDFTDSTDIKFE